MKSRLGLLLKFIFKILVIAFIVLFLFEISYRYNIIDFYKTESYALNNKKELDNTNVDLLVFGDSFSATSKAINYVEMFRKDSTKPSVVNYSIPGIGIRQVNTFASSKIKKHNPKAVLYQVYVGNDLIDVDHLWSWEKFSASRNMYWEASDYFLSLSYLNHRATIFSPRVNSRTHTMATDRFLIDYYDERTKRLLNFKASYLNNTMILKEPFKTRYEAWLKYMRVFLGDIPKDIKVYIVWIPHCAQVNNYYVKNYKKLGANFEDIIEIQKTKYPFFASAEQDLKTFKNVTQLNPLETFQIKDSISSRLYFANDPHINFYGNKVLFDFLQKEINMN